MDNLMNWYNDQCEDGQFNRLGVMAFVLLVQTCIIIPVTLLSISMNGNSNIGFALMAIFSFAVLVSFLGDLPIKFIIPLFALSTLVHLAIILVNVL